MAHGKRGRQGGESDDSDRGTPGPRAFWSGTLSFGLVSIPVELLSANRPGRPGLRLLGPSGAPLRRRYVCAKDGNEVAPEHLVRGYEVAPGEHVVVSDEELDTLAPEKSRDIDLTRFVPVEEVDPVRFDRAYYLAPRGESPKAYRLLADVMEHSGRAGIATFVMRGKEYLVAILAEQGILRAETLRFADEVRAVAEVGLPAKPRLRAAEIQGFARTIQARAARELDTDELEDPWSSRLEALAAAKRRRGEGVVESPSGEEAPQAEVIDLMAALKRSLGAAAGSAAPRTRRRAPTRVQSAAKGARSSGSRSPARRTGATRRSR